MSHRCSFNYGRGCKPGSLCHRRQEGGYYLTKGRVISPTGPVVYQRRLPRLRGRPTAPASDGQNDGESHNVPTPPRRLPAPYPTTNAVIPSGTPADRNHRGDDDHREAASRRLINACAMVGIASGSCTLNNIWRGLAPNEARRFN